MRERAHTQCVSECVSVCEGGLMDLIALTKQVKWATKR